MTTETANAIIALAALFLVAVTLSGWKPLRRKRSVLVVLKSGETLAGTLLTRRPSFIVLGNAAILAGERRTKIDGTVELDRNNVTWVQVT